MARRSKQEHKLHSFNFNSRGRSFVFLFPQPQSVGEYRSPRGERGRESAAIENGGGRSLVVYQSTLKQPGISCVQEHSVHIYHHRHRPWMVNQLYHYVSVVSLLHGQELNPDYNYLYERSRTYHSMAFLHRLDIREQSHLMKNLEVRPAQRRKAGKYPHKGLYIFSYLVATTSCV